MASQKEMINWALNQVGRWLDMDSMYGAQCVDLTMAYTKTFGNFQMYGNAIDYLTNPLPSGWTRYKTKDNIEAGDIAIWRWGSNDRYGHVGIVTNVNGNLITSVEQNVDGAKIGVGGIARLKTRDKTYLCGFIRPLYSSEHFWKSIKEQGTFIVGVDSINVRELPSTTAKIVANYTNGQSVNYDSYIITEGKVWISYISYSGVRRYMATGTHNGTKRTSTWGRFI